MKARWCDLASRGIPSARSWRAERAGRPRATGSALLPLAACPRTASAPSSPPALHIHMYTRHGTYLCTSCVFHPPYFWGWAGCGALVVVTTAWRCLCCAAASSISAREWPWSSSSFTACFRRRACASTCASLCGGLRANMAREGKRAPRQAENCALLFCRFRSLFFRFSLFI